MIYKEEGNTVYDDIRHNVCLCILQPDADYFKIDLHNSGEVMLAKALDYETKTQLFLTILASVRPLFIQIFNAIRAAWWPCG